MNQFVPCWGTNYALDVACLLSGGFAPRELPLCLAIARAEILNYTRRTASIRTVVSLELSGAPDFCGAGARARARCAIGPRRGSGRRSSIVGDRDHQGRLADHPLSACPARIHRAYV